MAEILETEKFSVVVIFVIFFAEHAQKTHWIKQLIKLEIFYTGFGTNVITHAQN